MKAQSPSVSPRCLLVVLSNMSMASSTWGETQHSILTWRSLATRHIAWPQPFSSSAGRLSNRWTERRGKRERGRERDWRQATGYKEESSAAKTGKIWSHTVHGKHTEEWHGELEVVFTAKLPRSQSFSQRSYNPPPFTPPKFDIPMATVQKVLIKELEPTSKMLYE